jgi:hypothetical protein
MDELIDAGVISDEHTGDDWVNRHRAGDSAIGRVPAQWSFVSS